MIKQKFLRTKYTILWTERRNVLNYDNYSCDNQMSIFDFLPTEKKKSVSVTKRIRAIEFFAGYGSQLMAFKRIGADIESYKISEWGVNANNMYKNINFPDDNTDYSSELTAEELPGALFELGISANTKEPMTFEQIKRKGEKWQRKVYNEFKANHNLGSVTNIKGGDLEITDTHMYDYILTYSFPCQ